VKRVVLMLDGSDESAQAARWCATELGSDVEVVAVTSISPLGEFVLGLPPSRGVDWLPEIRQALEDQWCAPLRTAGVTYRATVVEGSAVAALLDTVRREHADAIVIGKAPRRFLSEHLLGSVAADLVHHASVPVIVVPSGGSG
jgi:nucleotide-binding universal stress UspA family protein